LNVSFSPDNLYFDRMIRVRAINIEYENIEFENGNIEKQKGGTKSEI